MSETKTRSFKVKLTDSEKPMGRYTGNSPYQAANKALSEILRSKKGGGDSSEVSFSMVESTRNAKYRNKEHKYHGHRIKLDEPVSYTVNDRPITKQYKNVLRKLKGGSTTCATASASA